MISLYLGIIYTININAVRIIANVQQLYSMEYTTAIFAVAAAGRGKNVRML